MFSVAPVVTRDGCGLDVAMLGAFFASPSSSLLEVSSVSSRGRVRLYVGRRLRYFPRSGMKREFCTLVSVESVDTSGSA